MKKCKKCQNTKPYSDFGINKASNDGYSFYCKPCRRIYDKTRYKEKVGYSVKLTEEQKKKRTYRYTTW